MEQEISPRRVKKTTKNTYEAAFYLMNGAEIEAIRSIPVPRSKRQKRGYYNQWITTLKNIDETLIQLFEQGKAQVNLQEFENARRNYKREAKRLLEAQGYRY